MVTPLRSAAMFRDSFCIIALLAILGARVNGASLEVHDLRCDVAENPLGVDSTPPRLAWKLRSTGTDERQTAWQVLVASSPELLAQNRGDVWDSGRQPGDVQLNVPYSGRLLRSSEQVFWKVRVWNASGDPSVWSPTATWTMGVLTPAEWRAQWISDPELLRWVRPRLGFRSQPTRDENARKWIAIDLGAVMPVSTVRVYPVHQVLADVQGMPLRFVIEASESADFAHAVMIADHSAQPFNILTAAKTDRVPTFPVSGAVPMARYIRMTTHQLRHNDEVRFFALSQIEIISGGKNVAPGARVWASDSVEDDRWSLGSVVDGLEVRGVNPRENGTLLARREFAVKPALRRAVVHVSGLGHYELSINGRRVGKDLLSPGWTTYGKIVLYDTHDVTALLHEGGNALGVTLGGGMYNVRAGRYVKFESLFQPLCVIAQLRLEYADGSVAFVGTDEHWQVHSGPITFSNMYGGEDYDARLEPTGWDEPGFEAHDWSRAALVPGPGGELRGASHAAPPIRAFDVLPPVAMHSLRPGVTVYDLGQNVSLMPRLRVRGPRGSVVRIIPSELLGKEGAVDRGSCSGGTGEAWWQYTLAGRPEGEEWFPKFFYHGSRYLQVEVSAVDGSAQTPSLSDLPVVESLVGVVVHTSSPPAGDFACSNDLFNRIRTLIRWAQRSNLMSLITDCPHRERLGWLEQYHLNGPSLRYEFDLTRLYAKTFDDMESAQRPEGLVPDIAPEYVIFSQGFRDSPEWGSAIILAAWQHYQFTGDERPLRLHYDAMGRYVDYLRRKATGHILSHGLGDWYDIGPKSPGRSQLTPIPLTATGIFYEDLKTLATIASLLGKPNDARRFSAEAAEVRATFNRTFYHADQGSYATGSQCANAMPLVYGLVEPAVRTRVVDALVRDVRTRGLTAGDVGYRYLLRALADGGRSDVIYAMNNQSEKPGYGYQLAHGATSLTEAWNSDRGSSQNHFMLGQIMEWFYHDLAGIQPDPEAPGFARIVIRPAIVGDLTWVRATYQSPRGPITVAWKREGRDVELDVSIPVNATATVHVPGETAPRRVGSGTHHFTGSLR